MQKIIDIPYKMRVFGGSECGTDFAVQDKKRETVILNEKGREAMMNETFLLAFATFILFSVKHPHEVDMMTKKFTFLVLCAGFLLSARVSGAQELFDAIKGGDLARVKVVVGSGPPRL